MILTVIFYIVLVSLWLSFIWMALALSLRPEIIRLTKRLVCPEGVELQVGSFSASYHRPGEKGINVYYIGSDGEPRDVKAKALVFFWGICFLWSVPLSILVVILAVRWLAEIG